MANRSGEKDQESIGAVLAIIGIAAAIMFATVWLVASNKIVFYTAPILHWLGSPWGWLPFTYTEQTHTDLEAMYRLARRYPTRIAFEDWVVYANTSLRPLSVILAGVVACMGARLLSKKRGRGLQRKLTPEKLVHEMVPVFTDIAPIACIQKQLVQNKLKRWRRQVAPMELLNWAKYDGVPVIEPGQVLNEERLAQHFCEYTFLEVPAEDGKFERIRHSKYLGRQIVDLAVDAHSTDRCFVDRLSSVGKAVFALLVPGALSGAEGRAEAEKVVRALNWSAYGTRDGCARLDLPVVQEMFDKYRDHPSVQRLLQVHHWEYTFLYELQVIAGKSSKIGSWRYLWLRPMNRILFFILDTAGRHTPHAESAVAVFGQHAAEKIFLEDGLLPLLPVHEKDRRRGEVGKFMPLIFVPEVVKGFKTAFDEWVNGVDDKSTEQMWQSKDVWASTRQILRDLEPPPLPPSEALTEHSEFDRVTAEEIRKVEAAASAKLKAEIDFQTEDSASPIGTP
jgi:hypothetical protein